jgi:hypothetical protein
MKYLMWWHTPGIPAIQEEEIWRIMIRSQPGGWGEVRDTPYQ